MARGFIVTSQGPIKPQRPLTWAERLGVELLFRGTDLLLIGLEPQGRRAREAGSMPRFRFSVRLLMAGVAVAALASFGGVSVMRRAEASALAREEAVLLGWAAEYDLQADELRADPRGAGRPPAVMPSLVNELKAAAADARRRARLIRRKRLRCERAVRRPWLAVAPDQCGPDR